jgi:uncharacterized membrane protein
MARVEASVVINRPIEEVFTFAADMNKSSTWQSSVLETALISPGPVGQGTTYRHTMQFSERRLEATAEITDYEPPRKYAWKATSAPFPLSGGMSFEAVNGSTRVTHSLEAEPSGLLALAAPAIVRAAQQQFEADLKNLKELLEHGERSPNGSSG